MIEAYIFNLHVKQCIKPPTIMEFLTTVQQILTDTSRALPRSQRLFEPFDDGA